ncbi:hypothetical protein QOZ80_6BG0485950 [Eleusine coracana subsp. coracana]|nr:hypothetical protein QOZ80_6BG0485950 [Eleusine coracana subsp. coracana]
MSGQRVPSSLQMPPQPQPFRFWLPYRSRSNVGSWRQQPPRQPSSRPVSSSPPPPPPPTPAEPPHSRGNAVEEEDIPIQAESSDESETIPVQSSDSSQLRGGGRPSTADVELTLSGAPPPTGREQSSGGRDGGNNDTKIAISGFPRSSLFDGARAPFRQEIEDSLKSLAARGAPASRPPENGQQGYRVITLAGHNVGASMVVGNGGARDAHAPIAAEKPEEAAGSKPPAVAANVNSNVQSVNNSSMEGSTCSAGNPGVHVDIKNGREETPAAATVTPRQDEKPKEMKKRPPLVVPARPRRCLRALIMENESDTEAARKPGPGACRFQCVEDHTTPAPRSNDAGGAGGKNAEDGGNASTADAN